MVQFRGHEHIQTGFEDVYGDGERDKYVRGWGRVRGVIHISNDSIFCSILGLYVVYG